jgi:hypothetical protein
MTIWYLRISESNIAYSGKGSYKTITEFGNTYLKDYDNLFAYVYAEEVYKTIAKSSSTHLIYISTKNEPSTQELQVRSILSLCACPIY